MAAHGRQWACGTQADEETLSREREIWSFECPCFNISFIGGLTVTESRFEANRAILAQWGVGDGIVWACARGHCETASHRDVDCEGIRAFSRRSASCCNSDAAQSARAPVKLRT